MNSTNCLSCPASRFLSINKCVSCEEDSDNCVACEKTDLSFQCLRCAASFYLVENKDCLACSSGCINCTKSDNCYTCEIGYYLSKS